MQFTIKNLLLICFIGFWGCSEDSSPGIQFTEKLYVAAQGYDQVNIITVTNLSVVDEQDIIPLNFIENFQDNPHFVEIDSENGVWFSTVINSGFVVMADLETNTIIDNVEVGDSPALMVHHAQSKKLYVSRMMPMGNMGSESNIIQVLDYSTDQLTLSNEYELPSPSPHGIDISADGRFVFVASTTTDWIFKIDTETDEISSKNIGVDNSFEFEIKYLKPIQVRVMNDVIFVSCSANTYYNQNADPPQNIYIPGKIIAVDIESLEIIDEFEFEWTSTPWHITIDATTNEIFVALAGDSDYELSAGVACLEFNTDTLSLKWMNTVESIFLTLHGIAVSDQSDNVFVSGRGDGHLHILNRHNGNLKHSIPIHSIMNMDGVNMAMPGGIALYSPEN